MKIFVYKTLFVILCVYLLYEFTIGSKIRQFESQLNNLGSRDNVLDIKEKFRDEMKSALKKDRYMSQEDAKLISDFLKKVQKELEIANSE